jgi:predicted AAA+ superfamily ATPase
MTLGYSLEEFYNDIGNTNNIINKKFNKQTNLINFTFDDLSQEDIFQYFKNIRSYIVSDIMKLPENVT